MPRWILPAVVVGDVAVVAVLYAVLGWPALIVGLPLVICSVVVIVVVSVNGSRSPVPHIARAFVQASGHPRGPGGTPRPGGRPDDDWFLGTFQAGHHVAGPSGDDRSSHRSGPDTPWHHSNDPGQHGSGSHGWSEPGCSDSGPWSDSGSSSSSDSGCSTSDSGSSSSDSGSSSSSSSD